MPQTMMAFLAMMIASLAAIAQMTSQVESFDDTIRAEYELMANALVLEQMELIDIQTDYDDLETWDAVNLVSGYDVSGNNLDFDLSVSVIWVDDFGEPSGIPTDQKEVKIVSTNPRYVIPLVTHRRIFSN